MNKCINCGCEFTAKKSTTKYCSEKCKTYYNRKKLTGTLTGTNCNTKKLTGTVSVSDSDAKKKLASQIENIRKMTDERIDALPETSTKKEGEIKLRGRRSSEDYDGTTSPYIDWITDPKECPEDPYKVHCPDFDYESDAAAQQIRINKERSVMMKKK